MRIIAKVYILIAFDSDQDFENEEYVIPYDNYELKLRAKPGIVQNISTHCLSNRNAQREAYTAIFSFMGELSWL